MANGFVPANCVRYLLDEALAGFSSRVDLTGLPVVDERPIEVVEGDRRLVGKQPLLRRLHQRAVERRAHLQQHRAFGARRLG